MNYKMIDLEAFNEKDSLLVALENLKNVPFEIKRIFYIFNVPENAIRGNHANRDSEFLFIALSGSCEIHIDDGQFQTSIILDTPCKALYLDKMLWKQMLHFSKDCVLLVLASTFYNPSEYIFDYNEFLDTTGGGGQTFVIMPQWWHSHAV